MSTGMRIMTNVGSLKAQANMMRASRETTRSIQRLSSGQRINSAADDAAGSAVTTSLEARNRSYNQAMQNAQEGIALARVAESAYQGVSDILSRMRELAVQSANDSVSDNERVFINQEVVELKAELERIADSAEYNGIPLMAAGGTSLTFTIGAEATDTKVVDFPELGLAALGVLGMDVDVLADAQTALDEIDGAIGVLAGQRAELGSTINMFTIAVDDLNNRQQSMGNALNHIRDVDMARESAEFAKYQILQQASVAMLSQANSSTQSVLRLLQ